MYFIENKRAAIREVQGMLRTLSYLGEPLYNGVPMPHVPQDGIYGRQTADAVWQFQEQYRLTPTGRVDYQTFVALRRASNDVRTEPTDVTVPEKTLSRGDQSDDILLLHHLLALFEQRHPNVFRAPRGSYFGRETEYAVRQIQTYFQQPTDGRLTPRMFRMLRAYLSLPMTVESTRPLNA
ncbi:MAG: peptidoglycan-binding protein [Clostridia bacterium]|nr:peptidoglycan-binding protein [Clostridia bacterium]